MPEKHRHVAWSGMHVASTAPPSGSAEARSQRGSIMRHALEEATCGQLRCAGCADEGDEPSGTPDEDKENERPAQRYVACPIPLPGMSIHSE